MDYKSILNGLYEANNDFSDIIYEELSYISEKDNENWCIKLAEKSSSEKIWVLFGNLVIFALNKERFWLSFDENMLKNQHEVKWENNMFPYYKLYRKLEIRNGIIKNTLSAWDRFKHAHFSIIDKICKNGVQYLKEPSRKNHDIQLVRHLEGISKKNFPTPTYFYPEILKDMGESFKDDVFRDTFLKNTSQTEIEAIVKTRSKQNIFRKNIINKFESKCALCGLEGEEFLIASHIKPWSKSNNEERLSKHNGLLLCAKHDFLFDKGYISFENNGTTVLSKRLKKHHKEIFQIENRLLTPINEKMVPFLEYHRKNILS